MFRSTEIWARNLSTRSIWKLETSRTTESKGWSAGAGSGAPRCPPAETQPNAFAFEGIHVVGGRVCGLAVRADDLRAAGGQKATRGDAAEPEPDDDSALVLQLIDLEGHARHLSLRLARLTSASRME